MLATGPGSRSWRRSSHRRGALLAARALVEVRVFVPRLILGVFPGRSRFKVSRFNDLPFRAAVRVVFGVVSAVPLVRVVRSGLEESVHEGDVAVVDGKGAVTSFAGDPDRLLFARSSMKPLQATVSLSCAPLDFTDREIAVMCASHNAEPVHVETVRSLMKRAGIAEEALRCPAVRPWDEEAAAADAKKRRINSDCSGKHAGMLAASRAQRWPLDSYRKPTHPLQGQVLEAVLSVTGLESVQVGIDGCGVPVHGMPLRRLATVYARLGTPERWGPLEPSVRRIVGAMSAEPYMVAGRNRPDTALMEVAPNVIAKGGAEGLLCAAVLDREIGVAVKVQDGSHRAAGPALIRALALLGVLDRDQLERLEGFASPPVLGGGEPVGVITASFDLTS
jgi:L-asparaginase II